MSLLSYTQDSDKETIIKFLDSIRCIRYFNKILVLLGEDQYTKNKIIDELHRLAKIDRDNINIFVNPTTLAINKYDIITIDKISVKKLIYSNILDYVARSTEMLFAGHFNVVMLTKSLDCLIDIPKINYTIVRLKKKELLFATIKKLIFYLYYQLTNKTNY